VGGKDQRHYRCRLKDHSQTPSPTVACSDEEIAIVKIKGFKDMIRSLSGT
jgi:hypothetical protein